MGKPPEPNPERKGGDRDEEGNSGVQAEEGDQGTFVYEETDEIQPKIGTIYVKKYTVGAPAPEKLTSIWNGSNNAVNPKPNQRRKP